MNSFEKLTKKVIRICAGLGAIYAIGVNTLPHVFPAKSIQRDRVKCMQLKEKYKRMLKEVCAHMNIDPTKVHLCYQNTILQSTSSGCLHLPGAAVLGLAHNCSYSTVADISRSTITFEGQKVNWSTANGRAFADCLLHGDKQVKFTMAHELTHVKDMDFIPLTLHDAGYVFGAYNVGVLLAPYRYGLAPALLTQMFVWGIAFLLHKRSERSLYHWIEYKADRKAATLGLEYSDGGVDFCRNKLKVNCTFRAMNEETGSQLYTEEGEVKGIYTHPKFSERLKRVQEIRKSNKKIRKKNST